MKKLLLFVTMAASLLFTQCKKEDSVSSAGKTVRMTVTAGPGSKTDITENGAITWSDGDQLYVGDGSKYIGYLTLVGEGGSATGVFTGNVTLPTDTKDGEKSFGFFYLGSAERTLTVGDETAEVDFSSQDITKGTDGKLTNASKQHVGYGSATGTVVNDVVTDINVMLVSKVALAHFSFKKGDAAYTDGLTLKGDNICNKMTVNFDGSFTGKEGSTTNGISLGNGHGERYVMLVPTGDATAQSLTFTGDNVAGTGEVPGLQANQFYGKDPAIAVTLTPTKVLVESVSLNKTKLSLEVDGTETLIATVAPDNAADKSVTWSSSDESVATVSDAGLITAVAAGTATITVTATNGTEATDDDKTATCAVTVTAAHEYVDLGLTSGLLWATCNLGADSPEKYGDYYQWGGVESVTSISINVGWDGCPFTNGTYSTDNKNVFTKYVTTGKTEYWAGTGDPDNKLVLDLEDDAAHVNWGGDWRMPTSDEWQGLYNGTTSAWTDNYNNTGIAGMVFTSKTNGNTLFFPAAGSRSGTSLKNVGFGGRYWSSSLTSVRPRDAYYMVFTSGGPNTASDYRSCGFSVRPVR